MDERHGPQQKTTMDEQQGPQQKKTMAEQQRQYFVERLDILQLPPSVPPRSSG
jgi:hypothetical protein